MKSVLKKIRHFPSQFSIWRRLNRKQQRYFEIGVAFLLIILVPLLFFVFNKTQKVDAAWFSDEWGYRQTVSLTSPSSSVTDFQIQMTLNTATLIAAGKMQASCNDIRITDISGKLLPHWIETGTTGTNGTACNGTTTKIWTKVPSITTSGTAVYIYYGNPSAPNVEDGNRVFLFFDDFSGSSINTSKWTVDNSTGFSVTGGSLVGTSTTGRIRSITTFTGDYIAETRILTTTSPPNGFMTTGFWTSTTNGFGILDHNTTSYYRNDSGWTNFVYNGTGQVNRDKVKVVGTTATYFRTGETSGSATGSDTNSGLSAETITIGERYDDTLTGQAYNASWDFMLARKAITTEPTVGAPSNEEKGLAPIAYWKFDEGQGPIANSSIFQPAAGDTTNLMRNPSVETDLSNFSGAPGGGTPGNVTLTRSSDTALFGSYSMKWVRTISGGSVWFGDFGATATNATTYTYSFWARSTTNNSRTLSMRYLYTGQGESLCPTSTASLTSQWQRYTCTFTTGPSGVTTAGFLLRDDDVLNDPIYIDGMQIEASSTPSVYCDGSQTGQAKHVWTGTAHASTSVCNNGTTASFVGGPTWQSEDQCISGKCLSFDGTDDFINIATPSSNLNLGASDFTISMWFKRNATGTTHTLFSKSTPTTWASPGKQLVVFTDKITFDANSVGTITGTTFIQANKWYHVEVTFTDSSNAVVIYLDGKQEVNGTLALTGDSVGHIMRLGQNSNSQYLKGFLDDVKIYPYARTADQVKLDYNSRGTVKGAATSLGGQGGSGGNENLSKDLVGYWKMDESSWNGTTGEIKDASGNRNATAVGSATVTTAGKFGNAGNFDNGSKYASLTSAISLTNTPFTISAWTSFPLPTTVSGLKTLTRGATGDHQVIIWSDGLLGTYNNGAGTFVSSGYDTDSLSTGWHLITAVGNGSSTTFYVDGVAVGTAAYKSTTDITYFGNYQGGNQNWGKADDLRIYTRALSPAEVDQLYNFAPPPIVYYDFNERQGTLAYNKSTTATAPATLTNGPTWVPGKYGSAVNFDGSNDYVDAGNDPNLYQSLGSLSFSAWIKPGIDVASMVNWVGIVQKYDFGGAASNNSFGLVRWDNGSGKLIAGLYTNAGGSSTNVVTTTIFKANTWYHVAAVYNGATYKLYVNGIEEGSSAITGNLTVSNKNLLIGVNRIGSEHWTGVIDEVKVYNYARTTRQLVEDMNGGHPAGGSPVGSQVAYWKFDEGQGLITSNSTYKASGTIRNMVLNPSVEVDTTNWSLTGGHTRSTEKAAFGAASIKASVSGANVASNSSCITVSPSTAYTFSAYIYRVGGYSGNTTLDIIEYSDSGCTVSVLDGPNPGTTTTNQWVRVSVNQTMNASTIRVQLRYVTDGSATGTAYFDGAQLEQGSTTNIYCDGSLTGNPSHLWTGTAHASASSCSLGNDGDIRGPTWTNSGKFSNALSFDGVDDYVTTSNTASHIQSQGFTWAMWFRGTSLPTGTSTAIAQNLLGVMDTTACEDNYLGFGSQFSLQRELTFLVDNSGGCGARDSTPVTYYPTGGFQNGRWYHVAGVRDFSGGTVKLYLDGILVASKSMTGTAINRSQLTNIGRWYDGSTNTGFFSGLIDEVKIYGYALSSDEVKIDYNQGSASVLGAISTAANGTEASNSASRAYCVPGDTTSCAPPVGEWTFDEGIGGTVYDISGNGNTATWSGTLGSQWNPGKVGKAGNFNGTNNYLYINAPMGSSLDITTNPVTMEAWIKTTSPTTFTTIYSRGNSGAQAGGSGYAMALSPNGNGKMNIGRMAGGNFDGNQVLVANTWYHVVGIINGANSQIWINGKLDSTGTVNVAGGSTPHPALIGGTFGAVGPNPLNVATGQIDNVKIFNYARTPAQIAWDYSKGAPVGHWKFDECQGTTLFDNSGNKNNGTWNATGGTYTSPGSCTISSASSAWYNGRNGKINSSLAFDGTDDYVGAGTINIASEVSAGAWVYSSNFASNMFVVQKAPVNAEWELFFETTLKWRGGSTTSISCPAPTNSQWHHVFGTQTGTTATLYIDGVRCATGTVTAIPNGTGLIDIGRHSAGSYFFNGQIDDVRIYNYALTPYQVRTLYNDSSAVRWAPITGTP